MSYDDTDLSPLNTARSLLGDTSNDPTSEHFTDDHIEAIIAGRGYNAGVSFLASEFAAWAAQQPDRVALPGNLSFSWSDRVKQLNGVAAEFGALAASEGSTRIAPIGSVRTYVVW